MYHLIKVIKYMLLNSFKLGLFSVPLDDGIHFYTEEFRRVISKIFVFWQTYPPNTVKTQMPPTTFIAKVVVQE